VTQQEVHFDFLIQKMETKEENIAHGPVDVKIEEADEIMSEAPTEEGIRTTKELQDRFPEFVLIPCKKCDQKGAHKVPLGPWKKVDQTNTKQLNSGHKNWAVRTGEISGLFVIDVDIQDEGLKLWLEKWGRSFPTVVNTPKGGMHIYFNYTKNISHLKSATKLHFGGKMYGIDIFGNHKYVVCPPSNCRIGGQNCTYEFVSCEELQPCPQEIIDWIQLGQKRSREIEPSSQKKAHVSQVEASDFMPLAGGFPNIADIVKEQAERYCNLINPTILDDFDTCKSLGFALANTFGKNGWEMFEKHSKRNHKYDKNTC